MQTSTHTTLPLLPPLPPLLLSSPALTLVSLRRLLGLSQTDLSSLTRIPQSHLSAYENGHKKIGSVRASRIANALGVSTHLIVDIINTINTPHTVAISSSVTSQIPQSQSETLTHGN